MSQGLEFYIHINTFSFSHYKMGFVFVKLAQLGDIEISKTLGQVTWIFSSMVSRQQQIGKHEKQLNHWLPPALGVVAGAAVVSASAAPFGVRGGDSGFPASSFTGLSPAILRVANSLSSSLQSWIIRNLHRECKWTSAFGTWIGITRTCSVPVWNPGIWTGRLSTFHIRRACI